jgi:choline-sulfatase
MANRRCRQRRWRGLTTIVVVAAVIVAGATTLGQTAGRPARQPNILVIMSDEHNASIMGCAGNKLARTPNLDRLAGRGILFNAHYTTSPLCAPARASFTLGKYISHIGVWNNSSLLPADDAPSLPRILNAAGYESFLCGKMHYDPEHRYGFTEIGRAGTNQERKTGSIGRRRPDDLAPPATLSGRFDEFHPGDTSGPLKHDRAVTAGVTGFLAARKKTDKPFFLFAGFLSPHFPIIVPEKYWEPFKGKVPMPEIPPGYLDTLPLNYRHLRVGFQVVDVPDDVVRRGRELYYGYVQWMDEEVGKVLKALDDSGLADDTVVIYTTDHGENMGEHGLWWKNCVFDSAARTPLIISWPKRWAGGQKRDGACSLVDVARTIADIGGAKAPTDWDGDSMCPWMDDSKASWKDLAVSEYYAHNIASGYAMLRAGQYKYVYHTPPDAKHPAERELYELKADPGELDNLAADPAMQGRIREMHTRLVKELGEDPDKTELRARASSQSAAGETDRVRPNRQRKQAQKSATKG